MRHQRPEIGGRLVWGTLGTCALGGHPCQTLVEESDWGMEWRVGRGEEGLGWREA